MSTIIGLVSTFRLPLHKVAKWGQKAPSKQQSDGKKRHHSDKREKSHGGGKCHQNGKVVAENATKTVK